MILYCVQTARHIVKIYSPPSRPIILALSELNAVVKIPTESPLNWALNAGDV